MPEPHPQLTDDFVHNMTDEGVTPCDTRNLESEQSGFAGSHAESIARAVIPPQYWENGPSNWARTDRVRHLDSTFASGAIATDLWSRLIIHPSEQNQPQQTRSDSARRSTEESHGFRVRLVLALLLVLAVSSWFIANRKPPVDKPEPEAAADPISALINERERLDETVWQDEVQAQRYEDYFVQLWDDLRAATDKMDVLANASFERLEWGQPKETNRADWQILVTDCDGAKQTMDNAEFAEQVRSLARAGFRIVQTEWHHSRFETGEPGEARSTVSIRIDAINESSQTRYAITGDLLVQWDRQSTPESTPRPHSIDARGLRITQRQGPVGFETVRTIDHREIGVPLSVPSIIVYDLDGDGLSELLIPSANLLYRNRGGWQFDRLPLLSFPSNEEITASLAADFNGDGRVDLLCASAGFPILYLADEQGGFTTRGISVDAVGEELVLPSVLTAGDVDADGDLDVWLAQYKPAYHFGQMPTPYYDANDGFPSCLLLNDGTGRFLEATESHGLAAKRHRRTYSGSFIDLDEDGDLDLAVASDYAGLDLYLNDGAGTFQDVTSRFADLRHCFGMSLTFADFNLDERMDLYMTGMASTTARRLERLGLGREEFPEHQQKRALMGYGNRMYLAQADGFRQAPFNDQVARTGWSWGSTSFDFDNDADFDIYIANGHRSNQTAKDYCTRFWTHDIYTSNSEDHPEMVDFFRHIYDTEVMPISWNGFEHNCLLMNLSGTGFMKVGFLMGVAFEFDSRNVISDDFDGDGRRDLLVVGRAADATEGSIHLVRNVWTSDHHWIGVHLREQGRGRSPLGARVHVVYEDGQQVASIVAGDSLYSQHATTAHFGLGNVDAVERIEIQWTDGSRTRIERPQVDRYHVVDD